MGSNNPRPPDPRREPDSDDDEIPTDIMSRRDLGLAPSKPKLRLDSGSVPPPESGPDDSTLIVRRTSSGFATAAMPRTMRAWIEVLSGPAAADSPFPITMVKTVIGRGHQADVRIRDGRLSRKHATIFFNGTEFRIRDENSGNGTLLNGSRVVEYCVKDGDEIVAGGSVFRFRAEPL